MNVPLKDGIDDATYEGLFRPIVDRIMETFQPEVVVFQCGGLSQAVVGILCVCVWSQTQLALAAPVLELVAPGTVSTRPAHWRRKKRDVRGARCYCVTPVSLQAAGPDLQARPLPMRRR